jgi:hypothetical protein
MMGELRKRGGTVSRKWPLWTFMLLTLLMVGLSPIAPVVRRTIGLSATGAITATAVLLSIVLAAGFVWFLRRHAEGADQSTQGLLILLLWWAWELIETLAAALPEGHPVRENMWPLKAAIALLLGGWLWYDSRKKAERSARV